MNRWLMFVIVVAATATVVTGQETPPPLTSEQIAAVRTLVQRTQAAQTEAKEALTAAQEKLSREYANYELDAEQVAKLQAEIIAQQQRLLDSHHRLHVELRKIVGAERFQVLSKRIENLLKNPPPPATNSGPTNSRDK